jgi:hypothetical protein
MTAGLGFVAAALFYARSLGLFVFPCVPRRKEPLTPHGHLDATTDINVMAKWGLQWPKANVAIACRPSRLAVMDVDPRNGGDDGFAALERQHGPVPATWRALTGGGGVHVVFQAPADVALVDGALAPGIDLKANGYIVVPPSLHPSGRRYLWEVGYEPGSLPLAAAPNWLVERVRSGRTNGMARLPDEWAELVRGPIAEGTRNDSLARLTGYLLRCRPAPRVVHEIVRAVNEARCTPPLSDEEIARTVDSIARREVERLRHVDSEH